MNSINKTHYSSASIFSDLRPGYSAAAAAQLTGAVGQLLARPKGLRLNPRILLAFAAVYLIWGSTFLAIHYGIASLPPWLLVFGRYGLAGAVMLGLARLRREAPLNKSESLIAIASGLLLVLSNAMVVLVQQWLPTGLAAVIIAAMPIWIMLLGWAFFAHPAPTAGKLGGALLGLAGIGLIVKDSLVGGALGPVLLLLLSSSFWALGTLTQTRLKGLSSLFRFSGLQMLAGASLAGLSSLGFEAPWRMDFAAVSPASWSAVLYLAFAGSVIAFTAYNWLSHRVEPHLVSTYALVNPVIAVALGSLVLAEPISAAFLGAVVLVVAGVGFLIKG